MENKYLDITGSTACWIKSIRSLCNKNRYTFTPKNKMYYEIDKSNKTCNGVDLIPSGSEVYGVNVSFTIIRK